MAVLMLNYLNKETIKRNGYDFFRHFDPKQFITLRNSTYSIIAPTDRCRENPATNVGVVQIIDIMFDEIKDCYEELCKECGKEKIDAIAIHDDSIIAKKLVDVIYLAMDRVFHVDELVVSFVIDPHNDALLGAENLDEYLPKECFDEFHSTDNIIYYTLQENFIIISQYFPYYGVASIKIKKKG